MAKTFPKAGYKGAIYFGTTKIGGGTTWAYGGNVRNMQAVDEFEEEVVVDLPLQIVGGEVTITGNYLIDNDAGQQLLATKFDSGEQITNLKLYLSKVDNYYLTPKASSSPASYATVTNYSAISHDKSGVGTFTATLKISGVLETIGISTAIQVSTVGVHGITAVAAEFVGSLDSMGGVTPVVCKFEYGTTISYGTSTTPTDSMTAIGLFGCASGTLVTGTTYHYRAVATYGGVSYYGADKTFTTL